MNKLNKLDLPDLPFQTLTDCYLFSETPEDRLFYLNEMVNSGSFDEDGWVGICIYYPELKEFALEVMKLYAVNHHYETTYYQWMMLVTYLPKDDPFRNEVIKTIKRIDKQQ